MPREQDKELSEKELIKVAYLSAFAQSLMQDREVIGPTIHKLREAGRDFDATWRQLYAK